MPKQKSVPSYRYHKARDCAVVTINGRNHYLGVFNSPASKEKYARLIAELATGIAAPAKVAAHGHTITVTELCATYLEWAASYYVKNGRATSQVAMIRMSLRSLRRVYGSIEARSFGPLSLESLQQYLVNEGRSRSYINKLLGEVRRLFKWAARKEIVPVTVYQSLATVPGLARGRTTARETAPVLPVDDATVAATLPYLSPVVADMVRFQALVGCRPTEVCLVRPADVDTSGEVWVYAPAEHKTEHHGRERRIFIGPRAQEILVKYLDRPQSSFCFSPQDSEAQRKVEMRQRRKSKVQPSQTDRRKSKPKRSPSDHYTKDSYNRAIHRAVKKANQEQTKKSKVELGRDPTAAELEAVLIKSWSPNQLRHAAATEIRRQFGIEAAQTVLGHSKADVTQVYAERDWRKAAEVMQAIG